MEFVKAMKIRKRICETSKQQGVPEYCIGCPLSSCNNPAHTACASFIKDTPELAEPILEQWNKEHPVLTRADKLHELCPNARTFLDNIPVICPMDIDCEFPCTVDSDTEDSGTICNKCRRDFWTAEWEDKND